MINEVTFSTRFNALWGTLTPIMEHFVRSVNLSLYERYEAPVDPVVRPTDRAMVSEAAFVAYKRCLEPRTEQSLKTVCEESFDEILREAYSKIQYIRGEATQIDVSDREFFMEMYYIAENIRRYFEFVERSNVVQVSPAFPGVGYVDGCEADFRCDTTIIEMKNVERSYRATDFRQLLTYCTLAHSAGMGDIKQCAIFNARRGTYWKDNIESFVKMCAGKSASILFEEIVYATSSGDISR